MKAPYRVFNCKRKTAGGNQGEDDVVKIAKIHYPVTKLPKSKECKKLSECLSEPPTSACIRVLVAQWLKHLTKKQLRNIDVVTL